MSIKFLGLDINPSKVSAIQFMAKDVMISASDIEIIKSLATAKKDMDPRRSDLNIYFVLEDGAEELCKLSVSSCVYDANKNDPLRRLIGHEADLHSDSMSAITHEFNRIAIKAGYPIAFKPENRMGNNRGVAHEYFSYWLDAGIEKLDDAITASGNDDGYPIEYVEAADMLKTKINEALDACINSARFTVGTNPQLSFEAETITRGLCRFAIDHASIAFNDFSSKTPQSESGIHEAASELAISFIEHWILSGLYFPKEDTRDFYPKIEHH